MLTYKKVAKLLLLQTFLTVNCIDSSLKALGYSCYCNNRTVLNHNVMKTIVFFPHLVKIAICQIINLVDPT